MGVWNSLRTRGEADGTKADGADTGAGLSRTKRGIPGWAPLAAAGVMLLACVAIAVPTGLRYIQTEDFRQTVAEREQAAAELRTSLEEARRQTQELETRVGAAEREIKSIKEERDAKAAGYQAFLEVSGSEPTAAAAGELAVTLLEARGAKVEEIRSYLAADVSSLSVMYGGQEYALTPAPDIPRETLKNIVGAVAGEFGGTVAGVAGDALAAVTDRFDGTAASVGDGLAEGSLESLTGKVTDALHDQVKGAVDEATGGAVSGMASVQGAFQTISNLLDTTPDHALALTVNAGADSAERIIAVLDDPAADTQALRQAVMEHDRFAGFMAACGQMKQNSDLFVPGDGFLYDRLAEVEELDRAIAVCLLMGGAADD